MQRLYLALFLLKCTICESHYELPNFVAQCTDNADLSKCSGEVLENLRPFLVKGIPELKLHPIDPLKIPVVKLQRDNSNIANYKANLTNMVWTGMKNYRVSDIFVSLSELVFRLKFTFPHLLMKTDMSLDGTVLGFEINGAGICSVSYTRFTLDVILNGVSYQHEGREFVKWKTEDLMVSYDEAQYVELYGFFDDPILTQILKFALNRGVRSLGVTLRMVVTRSVGNFIVDAVNRIHKMYPKNVLYSL